MAVTRFRVRPGWFAFVSAAGVGVVIAAGCGDDSPTGTGGTPEPVRQLWQGTYAAGDQSDHGSFLLDVVRTGNDVAGELVFRSGATAEAYDHLFVAGTAVGNEYRLGANPEVTTYPFSFSLDVAVADSQAAGAFSYEPTSLAAVVALRELPLGGLAVQWSLSKAEGILGLAYDGTNVWASTLTDFLLLDTDGNDVSRVSVYYRPQTLWTSDALTSDGAWLWGQYPETVVDQSGTHNQSILVKFGKDGTIDATTEIPVRAAGLAEDAGDLWVLPIESDGFHRFDAGGTEVANVPVSLPDMIDVDFDGAHFWAIGWFIRVLYEIDRNGAVVRAYALPRQTGIEFPAGIVTDGSSFWYASGGFELVSTVYKFRLNP